MKYESKLHEEIIQLLAVDSDTLKDTFHTVAIDVTGQLKGIGIVADYGTKEAFFLKTGFSS